MSQKTCSWEELDELWAEIKQFIIETLEDKEITHASLMHAYTAVSKLEHDIDVSRGSASWNKVGGVHGMRTRIVLLVQQYADDDQDGTKDPEADLEEFARKWQRASKFIFNYHERMFSDRLRRQESNNRLPAAKPTDLNDRTIDDGTTTIYELGIEAWKQRRREERQVKQLLARL